MEILSQKRFFHEAERLIIKSQKTPSYCMFPGCTKVAINSHIFQANGILNVIAPSKHLYCFEQNSLFEQNHKFSFKRKGISQALSFHGFCKHHDNQIFSSIEKTLDIEWFNIKSQFLIGYKILCRELNAKELINRTYTALLERFLFPKAIEDYYVLRKKGLEMGVNDLERYKIFLESAIFNNNYSHYRFETYTLPFNLELCLASPISVSYSTDIANKDILYADLPETNIIAIFPHKQKTYLIVGFGSIFDNQWAFEFTEILKTQNLSLILKTISDLILFRSDFNCLSEKLYHSIPDTVLKSFYEEFEQNINFKNYGLTTKTNIFEHLK